ncbi:hypothetical protein WM46_15230 [Citrobacter freundii complex sp. CFNIH2]|uniref:AraC family transcriptional regulator n=1 Tax=Citrobacter freundii complex sp. CFNIH2 TaxID=2066049 RepID=UPI000C86B2CF|nr:helix-turn-helix transcriptional regulator [Citrobacter freundii complex sp. CFNIH2]AUO66000.1 hypothetical protein WM46_15230 [Citrobacter freundii complex sp. CFNIH2]
MSSKCQYHLNPDLAKAPVVGRSDFSEPEFVPYHKHERHQLSFAIAGVLHLTTTEGKWVLPPSRAMWIRAGTEHATEVKRPAQIRTLYIDANAYRAPTHEQCMVVEVTPLLRELILSCAEFPWNYQPDSVQSRLAHVLVDQFQNMTQASVDIPLPVDPRAVRVVNLLREDPANRESLHILARKSGASARTIERIFAQEVKMTFSEWRLRLRMTTALELLAYGENVTNVAIKVGYESSSSFVAAFRTRYATTPARFFRNSG